MPKSVLGNDPFKTAAVPTEKSTTKTPEKPSAKKPVKSPAKATDGKKKPAEKSQPKPATKKTAIKPKAKKKAPASEKPKNAPSKTAKAAQKASASKDETVVTTVPNALSAKETDKPQSAATPLETAQPISETAPILTAQAAKPEPEVYAGVEVSPRAIGGGDPKLLKLLRPDDFSIGQEFGADPSFRERLKPLLQFFYRFYWRVSVKGVEHLPKDGRAVLVCNHAGILPFDALMLAQAVQREAGREVWPLIEDFFYHAPILGPLLSRAGCVRACQENAQRLLAQENLVAVFPEGIKGIVKSYRKRYRLQRFGRGGFVKLCLQTDSPAVPVAIVGSEEAHPLLANIGSLAKLLDLPFFPVTPLFPLLGPFGLLPLPSKWTIVIGEPLYVNQFGPEAANDRVAINRLSNQVKNHIQKMIDMELGLQRSRWR